MDKGSNKHANMGDYSKEFYGVGDRTIGTMSPLDGEEWLSKVAPDQSS